MHENTVEYSTYSPTPNSQLPLSRRLLTLFEPRKTSRWLLRNLSSFPVRPDSLHDLTNLLTLFQTRPCEEDLPIPTNAPPGFILAPYNHKSPS
jgi:hypothetical protein